MIKLNSHFYPLSYTIFAYLRHRQILSQITRQSPPSDPCPPMPKSVVVTLYSDQKKMHLSFQIRGLKLEAHTWLVCLKGSIRCILLMRIFRYVMLSFILQNLNLTQLKNNSFITVCTDLCTDPWCSDIYPF